MIEKPAIHSEKTAHKLAQVRNLESPDIADQLYERPRLAELLWFIQWKSMQPGGLAKFAAELVQEFFDHFCPKSLLKSKGAKLSYQEKRAIYGELPASVRNAVNPTNFDARGLLDETPLAQIDTERDIQIALKDWDGDRISAAVRDYAIAALPAYLAGLCQDPDLDFSGETPFCKDAIRVLFAAMDSHKSRVMARPAQTAVTEKVFDALDYAQSERCMVRIEGDSRFGKTESIKAWCESRPGQARLVNVPSSNTLVDLLRKVADSLGIPWSYNTTQGDLKIRVEYVIKHSGLFLVMDEGAFLLPQSYGRNTCPARLNWVRTEIVDRGLPLAVVVTPQSFAPAVKRFVRTTGYAIEQFTGRTLLTVPLPTELEEKDLIAVARVHFPELDDNALGYVAAAAMISENYLMAVEAIAKRARFIAKRRTQQSVTHRDLDQAISEVIPQSQPPAPARQEAPAPETQTRARRAAAKPFKAPEKAIETRMRQAPDADETEPVFNRRSLRGAGLERTEADLIAVES